MSVSPQNFSESLEQPPESERGSSMAVAGLGPREENEQPDDDISKSHTSSNSDITASTPSHSHASSVMSKGFVHEQNLWRAQGEERQCRNQEMAEQYKQLQAERQYILHQMDTLQQDLKRERQHAEKLSASWHDQRRELDRYETELREAQVKSFKEMAQTEWAPEEDSVIQRNLEILHKNGWSWVKTYSIDSMDKLDELPAAQQDALAESLPEVTRVLKPYFADDAQRLYVKNHVRKAPALCVAAALSHNVFVNLFQNPFFFLDAGKLATDGVDKALALQRTLERLTECTFISLWEV